MSVLKAIKLRDIVALEHEWNYLCDLPYDSASFKKRYRNLEKWIFEGDRRIAELVLRKILDLRSMFVTVHDYIYINTSRMEIMHKRNNRAMNRYRNYDCITIQRFMNRLIRLVIPCMNLHPDLFTKITREINLIKVISSEKLGSLSKKITGTPQPMRLIMGGISREEFHRDLEIRFAPKVHIKDLIYYNMTCNMYCTSPPGSENTTRILIEFIMNYYESVGYIPHNSDEFPEEMVRDIIVSFAFMDDTDPAVIALFHRTFDNLQLVFGLHHRSLVREFDQEDHREIFMETVDSHVCCKENPNIIISSTVLEFMILHKKYNIVLEIICILKNYRTDNNIFRNISFTRVLWIAALLGQEDSIDFILDRVIQFDRYIIGMEVAATRFQGANVILLYTDTINPQRVARHTIGMNIHMRYFSLDTIRKAYDLLCVKTGYTANDYDYSQIIILLEAFNSKLSDYVYDEVIMGIDEGEDDDEDDYNYMANIHRLGRVYYDTDDDGSDGGDPGR